MVKAKRLRWLSLLGGFVLATLSIAPPARAVPGASQVAIEQGDALVQRGDYQGAKAVYQQAIRLDPQLAVGYARLATIAQLERNPQGAAQLYLQAIRLAPNEPYYHNALGTIYYQHQQYPAALQYFQRAASLGPNSPFYRVNYANTLYLTGQMDGARIEFGNALKLDPRYYYATAGLARIALAKKDFTQAIGQFEAALQTAPNDAGLHNEVGSVYFQAGNNAEGIRHFQRAVQLLPREPQFHNNLGAALVRSGQAQQGVRELSEAVRLSPTYANAHGGLALALHQLGQDPKAASEADEYLRLYPGAPANDSVRLLRLKLQPPPAPVMRPVVPNDMAAAVRAKQPGPIFAATPEPMAAAVANKPAKPSVPAPTPAQSFPSAGNSPAKTTAPGNTSTPAPSRQKLILRPPLYGRPAAVSAAIAKRNSGAPALDAGSAQILAGGAFIARVCSAWQMGDQTSNAVMFVSREVPDFGVLFEWGLTTQLAPEERARWQQEWLSTRYSDVERLPDSTVAGFPAENFAWVDKIGDERRESLQVRWVAGNNLVQATATATPAVWAQYGDQVFALLDVRQNSPRATATDAGPAAAGDNGGAMAKPATLTVVTVIRDGKPAVPKGERQNIALATGGWSLHPDESWTISDTGRSYAALTAADNPNLSMLVEWQPAGAGAAVGDALKCEMEKLGARYERIESLPDRTIHGVAARQLAWASGAGEERRESLLVVWIDHGMLLRATIIAPPALWPKNGPAVLRLLADISKGE